MIWENYNGLVFENKNFSSESRSEDGGASDSKCVRKVGVSERCEVPRPVEGSVST